MLPGIAALTCSVSCSRPVEDELVKVTRIGSRTSTKRNSVTMMDTDDPNPLPPSEFTQQVLSGVRFSSLLQRPNICTVLPSTVWNPSIHYQYPDSFRDSCREILLCSNAPRHQKPRPVPPKSTENAAGLLPRVLWMEILSYTHRDCESLLRSDLYVGLSFSLRCILDVPWQGSKAPKRKLSFFVGGSERSRNLPRELTRLAWKPKLAANLQKRRGTFTVFWPDAISCAWKLHFADQVVLSNRRGMKRRRTWFR